MTKLASSDLDVFPLCLGGNVFGWTADRPASFAILDGYREAGGNFIDTADAYSAWIPGNVGGESETILGQWLSERRTRASTIVATKVGKLPGFTGLSAKTIRDALEASLRRLQTDYVDLYYAHADDESTPLEETLRTFDALVREGKVRYIAASNYTAPRLQAALDVSKQNGFARYIALQPHYNLLEREHYEGELAELCAREGLACLPYFGLARGFLSGKYRPGQQVESQRAAGARAYLDERGLRVLAALDRLAAQHLVPVSAVALAWLLAQPTVVAPIASARTREQLSELLALTRTKLSPAELVQLNEAAAK